MKKMTGDNRGLSLIELLVAITVLGIICIPLITAFINSARINRNAQRVQSASTLAQSIMEEYKATSLPVLLQDVTSAGVDAGYYASLTPEQQEVVSGNQDAFIPYVFYRPSVTASNGHVYDARITLNPMPYSSFDLTVSNASNTNTVEIPSLPQVDNAKSAVISNQINAQDKKTVDGAINYPAEEKILALFGEYTSQQLADNEITKANISADLSKEIVVTVSADPTYVPTGSVLITSDVHYIYSNGNPNNHLIQNAQVTINAFQGFYSIDTIPVSDDPADTEIEGRMTVYLFWTPSPYNSGNDIITIENKTDYRIDVYMVKQEDSVGGDFKKVYVKGSDGIQTEFDPNTVAEHENGRMCGHNVNLITNMGRTGSAAPKLYDNVSKVRCYEVTVELFEGNGVDVYDETSTAQVVTMTSTKEVYQ